MKLSTAIFFALIVSLQPCLAELGESRAENARRYGKPLAPKFDESGENRAENIRLHRKSIENKWDESGDDFKKNGMLIETVSNSGKIDVMTYQKTETDASGNFVKMTDAEIKLLLAENVFAAPWVKVREGVWGHKTEQKAAYYDAGENRLYVCTKSAKYNFEKSIDLYMRISNYEKVPEKWERILEKITIMDSWWPK